MIAFKKKRKFFSCNSVFEWHHLNGETHRHQTPQKNTGRKRGRRKKKKKKRRKKIRNDEKQQLKARACNIVPQQPIACKQLTVLVQVSVELEAKLQERKEGGVYTILPLFCYISPLGLGFFFHVSHYSRLRVEFVLLVCNTASQKRMIWLLYFHVCTAALLCREAQAQQTLPFSPVFFTAPAAAKEMCVFTHRPQAKGGITTFSLFKEKKKNFLLDGEELIPYDVQSKFALKRSGFVKVHFAAIREKWRTRFCIAIK